jgi:hypothetical protein
MALPKGNASDPAAIALLEATQQAHGKQAFAAIREVNVSYDGVWSFLVTKIQPILTDPQFRKSSKERMLFAGGQASEVFQQHTGPAGIKLVAKRNTEISVSFNEKPSQDPLVIKAAHLVLEAYQLFLYPAFYVQRAQVLQLAEPAKVDGLDCDVLLAVMRPGIGASLQDSVMLYIDRNDRLVRRVRITLEGTPSTAGAIVDVQLSAFKTVAGVRWPTKFYEDLVSPFRGLAAHDFWVTGLDAK